MAKSMTQINYLDMPSFKDRPYNFIPAQMYCSSLDFDQEDW